MTNIDVDRIFDGPAVIEDANVPWKDVFREDFHVIIYRDKFPVSEGHLLFVPRYNSIYILNDAFEDAVRYGKDQVTNQVWDGFNIGINYGEAAGQTVMWPHVHLIPRKFGDVDNPRGGVRHVIPGKGNYHDPNLDNVKINKW